MIALLPSRNNGKAFGSKALARNGCNWRCACEGLSPFTEPIRPSIVGSRIFANTSICSTHSPRSYMSFSQAVDSPALHRGEKGVARGSVSKQNYAFFVCFVGPCNALLHLCSRSDIQQVEKVEVVSDTEFISSDLHVRLYSKTYVVNRATEGIASWHRGSR